MKKNILLCALVTLATVSTPIYCLFATLEQAQTYANARPEYVEIDNTNWLDPNFSYHYKKQQPGIWEKIRHTLFPTPSVCEQFKQLLDELTNKRELNGYFGRFIIKTTPEPNTKFIIWGDLHGSFHSLIRDLKALTFMGALSDDFTIHAPYFFIFNGNVIDRSPYNLETLSLIMHLMLRNPERVIYLLGNHENKQLWQNFDFARELQMRCTTMHQQIPLEKEISRFFNTLPLALYLTDYAQKNMPSNTSSNSINLIRISYFPGTFPEINTENFAGFLDQKNNATIDQFNLNQQHNPSPKKADVKAIVKGEDRSTSFKPTEGLVLLDPDKGSVAWSILSSPNGSHRREFDFFYDAFVQITTQQNMSDWTIELYNQDVRTMLGIKKSATYNLVSGNRLEENAPTSTPQTALQPTNPAPAAPTQLTTEQPPVSPAPAQPVTTPAPAAQPMTVPAQSISAQQPAQPPVSLAPTAPTQRVTTPAPTAQPMPVPAQSISAQQPAQPPASLAPTAPTQPVTTPAPTEKSVTTPTQPTGSKQELIMGSMVGISRGLGPAGKAFADGIQLRIHEAREKQEMKNVLPQIMIEDDLYEPEKTRKIVENFIKNKVDTIIAPPGSPTLAAYYDLIKAGKILVLFPSTGIPEAHSSEFKYMLHYRGDDIFEGRVLAEYAATNLHAQNVVLFVQNDEFGLALLKGVQETFAKYPSIKVTEVKYSRNDIDFNAQIDQIKKNKFDVIIFLCMTTAAEEFVRQIGVEYLIGKKIIGNSDFSGEEISTFFTNKGLKLTKLSVVPNVETSTLPIVQQFRTAAQQAHIPFDAFTLESYMATDIALELIKRVQGPVTKEKIIEIAENLKNEPYKGLTLNFTPQKREIGHPLWVNTGDPDWKMVQEKDGKIII